MAEMADDFIKRKDVIEITAETGALETQARVFRLPAADVRPVVHAYWKAVDIGDGDLFYECSHCRGAWTLIDGTPKENDMEYCNRCGAQMDADMREVSHDS